MNDFSLQGKVALVTGGSRGIGAEIALALGRAGAEVAILYRSRQDEADAIAGQLRALDVRACTVQHDVADTAGADRVVEAVVAALGKLDILVNNAGIADLVPFLEVTREQLDRHHAVNVAGPFCLAQATARYLVSRGAGGRIVNVTSTNGFVAEALLAPYNASKGAMEMLTRSMAIELGPHRITVNSVAPGLIGTEIGEGFPLDPAFWDYARAHIPLGEIGEPRDVAGAVVFLAGPAARYITGQHIVVDGGLLAEQFPRLPFYRPQPSA